MGVQVLSIRSGIVDGVTELLILLLSWALGGYLLARLSDLRVDAALKRGENVRLGSKFGPDWQTIARVYVLFIVPLLFLVASLGRDGSTQREETQVRGDVEIFDADFTPSRFNQSKRTIAPLLCGIADGGSSAAVYNDIGQYCKNDVPELQSDIVLSLPRVVVPPLALFPAPEGSVRVIGAWGSTCFNRENCRVISITENSISICTKYNSGQGIGTCGEYRIGPKYKLDPSRKMEALEKLVTAADDAGGVEILIAHLLVTKSVNREVTLLTGDKLVTEWQNWAIGLLAATLLSIPVLTVCVLGSVRRADTPIFLGSERGLASFIGSLTENTRETHGRRGLGDPARIYLDHVPVIDGEGYYRLGVGNNAGVRYRDGPIA